MSTHGDQQPKVSEVDMSTSLSGQTVVVLGGSAGIGFETARAAAAAGARVIITGRSRERLDRAAVEISVADTAVFDVGDGAALDAFFGALVGVNHVMLTAGSPHYGPLLQMSSDEIRTAMSDHVITAISVARHAKQLVREGGSLTLMGGTGARRVAPGLGLASALTVAMPPLTAALALELAPVRVNLIAAGFVDTPLSATLLGDRLDQRRQQLRDTLPIGRVVGPADVAALALQLMTNTALTGATYDIDGGQQFVDR
jgi:NAD(P)-dependent dehydrogenase (short-subunit alcohol dehydrogenase family)